MLGDFVLEMVTGIGAGASIALPGVAPAGRVTWASRFTTAQPVFYVLDNLVMEEWGTGIFTPGSPSTLTRANVIGNSAGTTSRLNFTGSTRCYSSFPMAALWATLGTKVGRNLLLNGLFRVQQRGAGPFTATGYTADRWAITAGAGGGSRSISFATMADSSRLSVGDEEGDQRLAYVFTGGSAAGDYDFLYQNTENVRRTSGKTVTLSFWASAAPAGLQLGVTLFQSFGIGGSPSASARLPAVVLTLSSVWIRYAVQFAVPSVAGKTFGTTAGTDFLRAEWWLSSGSTNNGAAGGIGVQAGTVNFWGMQMEIGPAPSPMEKLELRQDLANCMRHYQDHNGLIVSGYGNAIGVPFYLDFPLPVTMRVAPTVALSNFSNVNCATPTLNLASVGHLRFQSTTTAALDGNSAFDITASAEL